MWPAVKTKRKSHFKSLKTIEIWIWIITPPPRESESESESESPGSSSYAWSWRSTTFPALNLARVELIITYNVVRRFDRPQPAIDTRCKRIMDHVVWAACIVCMYVCMCMYVVVALSLQAGKLCELSMNLYVFDWFILCCWRGAYASTLGPHR